MTPAPKPAATAQVVQELPWWQHYMNGEIVRRDETPRSIVSTMDEWHGGPKSALHQFVHGKPVMPKLLLKEIARVRVENVLPDQDALIRALEIWAFRECELVDATKSLGEARRHFMNAAEVVGLDLVRDLIAFVET